MSRSLFLCLVLVAGCAQFPALDDTVSSHAEQADYPQLVPLDGLVEDSSRAVTRNAETEAQLQARAAALRARANRLKRRVIDSATRTRMASGVQGV